MGNELWIEENYRGILGMKYRLKKTLFSGKSDFQTVDVVETEGHGRMLLNDGLVMVSERDEFVYHDMIAHVPLFVHPNPKNVLVIGGGDGGTVREVLRHPGVETCTMVEIDKMVVDVCKEFIPLCSKDLNHPKLNLIIGDGVAFVENSTQKYDVILVDSTDPIGPAQPLFGEEFYHNIKNCLTEDGIVISQGESYWYEEKMQTKLMSILASNFEIVKLYSFSNLTYPGGLWNFTFASNKIHPLRDFDEKKVLDSGLQFKYYNTDVHRAAFALPTFVDDRLKDFTKE